MKIPSSEDLSSEELEGKISPVLSTRHSEADGVLTAAAAAGNTGRLLDAASQIRAQSFQDKNFRRK